MTMKQGWSPSRRRPDGSLAHSPPARNAGTTGPPLNILVLGGTRFFGKTLVEQLGSAGHAVTVLSRGKLPPPAGAAHLVADRADPSALAAALAGRTFDVVIDNAAMNAAHVGAALDALGERTGHYVLTSTAAVYGDFAHGRIWRESDLGLDLADLERPLPGGDPYTIGKRAAEAVLWRGERSKVPFTVVRPGYVVGPHDHLQRMQFFLRRLHDGGPMLVPSGGPDAQRRGRDAPSGRARDRAIPRDGMSRLGRAHGPREEHGGALSTIRRDRIHAISANMKRIWFSMVAAVAMTACGGKVVVDGAAGIGGAGGAGGAPATPVACPSEAQFTDSIVMELVGQSCAPANEICASNNGCGGCSVTCTNGVWTSTNPDLCFSIGGAC